MKNGIVNKKRNCKILKFEDAYKSNVHKSKVVPSYRK